IFGRTRKKAGFRQLRREDCEMGALERFGCDRPNCTSISSFWLFPFADFCCSRAETSLIVLVVQTVSFSPTRRVAILASARWSTWLHHGIGVVIIESRFAQEKDLLMRFRRAILHAFRHRIWLMPNDLASQVPSIGRKSKSQHPRNANQVFGF